MTIHLHQQLSLFAGMGLGPCRSSGQASATFPGASMKLSERAAQAARRKLASFSRLAEAPEPGTPVDGSGQGPSQ